MAAHRVLLLGGHGKISMHLTPLLLSKSWNVTSVIRNPSHASEIESLGTDQPGKISVLVSSLDDVTSPADAQKVIDQVDPTIVVWSAGAGGKGGAARTKAVDEVAAKCYIISALTTPGVKKFLMVSFIASRRGRPAWWSDEDWKAARHVQTEVLPAYFEAKVAADECLVRETEKRGDGAFQMINLRPGTLTDDHATGKVLLGKTGSRGKVNREDVARIAVALLEREDTRGYFDLIEGDEDIKTAVNKLVAEGHDGMEGEDMERIYAG